MCTHLSKNVCFLSLAQDCIILHCNFSPILLSYYLTQAFFSHLHFLFSKPKARACLSLWLQRILHLMSSNHRYSFFYHSSVRSYCLANLLDLYQNGENFTMWINFAPVKGLLEKPQAIPGEVQMPHRNQ